VAAACGWAADALSSGASSLRPTSLSWEPVSLPIPGTPADAALNDVSCTPTAFCMAVGWWGKGEDYSAALVETWDGMRWSVERSPVPGSDGLLSVSCASPMACVAVGLGTGLSANVVDSWNGRKWESMRLPRLGLPSRPEYLQHVSCVSTRNCVAVGSAGSKQTLIEAWNGQRWHLEPSPSRAEPGRHGGNSLEAVSCSSPRRCIAIGSSFNFQTAWTLVESWNGARWSIVPSASGRYGTELDGLASVACASASDCLLVGDSIAWEDWEAGLAEHWNGRRSSVVDIPRLEPSQPAMGFQAGLSGVSCVSASDCVAVGGIGSFGGANAPVVERWDGSRWSTVSPERGRTTRGQRPLSAVSCVGESHFCMAVGNDGRFGGSGNGANAVRIVVD